MAVVQISRIQVRRGKAQTGTGFPQLASGEMGWAIDTQELYIGNGSVAEGSPAVGNTKILTQNDLSAEGNLLQQLQHIYRSGDPTIITGPSANSPISRLLQARLDDRVTGAEFGTTADGATDDTESLQRAIDQLFLNPTNKASANTVAGAQTRVVLDLTPGIYKITDTLYIPSYATIRGTGADKTIISYNTSATITASITIGTAILLTSSASTRMIGATVTGDGIVSSTVLSVVPGVSLTLNNNASSTQTNKSYAVTLVAGPMIRFVDDSSTIGSPADLDVTTTFYGTQPRGIELSGLTLHTLTSDQVGLKIDAVRDSIFRDLIIKGEWDNDPNEGSRGIELNAVATGELGIGVTTEKNIFSNVSVEGFTYAVYGQQDSINNIFVDCFVTDVRQGFVFGKDIGGIGALYGPRDTQILNCKFDDVKWHAVFLTGFCTGNIVKDCKFTNVGNDGSGVLYPVYPQIYFGWPGNISVDNLYDRTKVLGGTLNQTIPYIPELAGHATVSSFGTSYVTGGLTNTGSGSIPILAFRLPVPTDSNGDPQNSVSYAVNYVFKTSGNTFSRRGILSIVADIDSEVEQIVDEYDYTGGDDDMSLTLEFILKVLDQNGLYYTGAVGQTASSLGIFYINPGAGLPGSLNYTYSTVLAPLS